MTAFRLHAVLMKAYSWHAGIMTTFDMHAVLSSLHSLSSSQELRSACFKWSILTLESGEGTLKKKKKKNFFALKHFLEPIYEIKKNIYSILLEGGGFLPIVWKIPYFFFSLNPSLKLFGYFVGDPCKKSSGMRPGRPFFW